MLLFGEEAMLLECRRITDAGDTRINVNDPGLITLVNKLQGSHRPTVRTGRDLADPQNRCLHDRGSEYNVGG